MKKTIKRLWERTLSGIKSVLKELRDKRTIIIFLIVYAVMSSPVWVGYLLFFITGNPVHTTYATAYLLFWNVVPCTPFTLICVALTFALKKLLFPASREKKKAPLMLAAPKDE